jgi:nucleoside triphosphate pyrophosphatase
MASSTAELILASASPARAALLRAAGVVFVVEPAAVDEAAVKRETQAAGEPALACAAALAAEKACQVSRRYPEAIVVGADQVLAAGADWFDKPADLGAARAQLWALRGRTHILATAVCAAGGGIPLWRACSAPELTMRPFSEAFLDAYLAEEGESLCGAVGAYRVEGRGVQLFARISGDYFAVLGLPLIELLEFLRQRGMLTR